VGATHAVILLYFLSYVLPLHTLTAVLAETTTATFPHVILAVVIEVAGLKPRDRHKKGGSRHRFEEFAFV